MTRCTASVALRPGGLPWRCDHLFDPAEPEHVTHYSGDVAWIVDDCYRLECSPSVDDVPDLPVLWLPGGGMTVVHPHTRLVRP